MRLDIWGVARRYRGSTVERVELLQEGAVGLMRACRRFDPDLGTPFWAYATWCLNLGSLWGGAKTTNREAAAAM